MIEKLKRRLERLNAKIESRQSELAELKRKRTNLTADLQIAKKAAKRGEPPPVALKPDSLGELITESVLEPIAGLLTPESRLRKG